MWPDSSLEADWLPGPYNAPTGGHAPYGRPEGIAVSCEHLICAQCAGPVVEGRCPACREARQQVHRQHAFAMPQLLVAAILALAVVLLLAMHLGG
jgi:hypothetical protein